MFQGNVKNNRRGSGASVRIIPGNILAGLRVDVLRRIIGNSYCATGDSENV